MTKLLLGFFLLASTSAFAVEDIVTGQFYKITHQGRVIGYISNKKGVIEIEVESAQRFPGCPEGAYRVKPSGDETYELMNIIVCKEFDGLPLSFNVSGSLKVTYSHQGAFYYIELQNGNKLEVTEASFKQFGLTPLKLFRLKATPSQEDLFEVVERL